ncbi:glyoxalase superfamily protein [Tropicimonas marinistellae]|uniref:glyoxalase superfamily protein n=1 Tax=Tropicimonas marinistellae TaxID=1739787 RepID=UPI00082A510D|nr:glyoxalase superfamily protein [Tropicimonas marinistellae]
MTDSTLPTTLPAVNALKAQARRLRESLATAGTPVGHSRSLELLAAQFGYRDWNTLRAAADQPRPNRPMPPVQTGDRVQGAYLSQAFAGEVLGIRQLDGGNAYRVTLQFDEPVDVVTFESFSAYRRRVTVTIDSDGVSPQRTSDGNPHMRLAL